MATEQEQLEREIVRTRNQLGQDVDLLAEKVNPAQVARRRVSRVRGAFSSAKDRVMGSAGDAAGSTRDRAAGVGQSVADTAGQVRDSAGQAVETAGDAVQTAGREVRQRTEGNPLAAGLIAFGFGWLASSLIPASRVEERVGATVRDVGQEKLGPVRDEVTSAAREVADNLKEPARDAAQSVKETASDAASTVKYEGTSQAQDLSGQAKDAAGNVRDTATSDQPGSATTYRSSAAQPSGQQYPTT